MGNSFEGGLDTEGCLEPYSCKLAFCKSLLLWFLCSIADTNTECTGH